MSDAVADASALRRADWRWLLAEHRAGRALCLASGSTRAAVVALGGPLGGALGGALAERVDLSGPGDDGGASAYDLVVASDVAPRTLAAAAAALAPGGALVVVVDARRGPPSRRSLGAAGLVDVRMVAPWPSPDAAEAWLPHDGAGARYYLLRHPIAARSRLRRAWIRARHASALVGRAARRVRGAVILARSAPATGDARPWWVPEAERAASETARGWLLYTPGAGVEPRVLGMTIGRDGRPSAVVKLARTEGAARRMAHGADVLDHLARAGVVAAGMAPAPLGRVHDGAGRLVATIERALHGAWLDAVARRRTRVAWAARMTDWLVALAAATRAPERADPWSHAFAPTVARFVAACGPAVDRALLDESVACLAAAPPMPTVVEHHDFRPWNVYVAPSGALAAFDWDNARVDGLPALDLLQGTAFLGFALDRTLRHRRFGEARERQETGAFGAARRAGEARYADAVGLASDAMRAVRVFAWMGLAADEAESRARDGRPLTPADVPRAFAALWQVEARLALR